MGYAQLLMSGAIPRDEIAQAYRAIQRNAQAQARLVESLLDLSRILAGKLELNSEVLELSSVLALAGDALRPEALKKQISMEIEDASGIRVFGDAARLQQVFWNLLANAIKFTPTGGRVTVHVAAGDADVTVRVKDNGRGIPGSLLPVVFDRFKQGESDSAGARAGLGLGLALVREMVQAHQGTVTAESPGENLGTTFTVRLPLILERTPASLKPVAGTGQATDLATLGVDVLIVDDEPDARDMLATMLKTRGATVRTAGFAAAAFDAMSERPPDVVLADLGMAGEDGYSLIRRWRTREKEQAQPRVAAIAVTAYASQADREQAMAAGYDWHIAKPVDADEIVRVIDVLSSTDRANRKG